MPTPCLLSADRCVLVVVDLQTRLMDRVHRPSMLRTATTRLLHFAELFEVPVILTEQYPAGLGPTDPEVLAAYDKLRVSKRRVEKLAFGCCGEQAFLAALDELGTGRSEIVLAGIETHVCILQTAFGLLSRDYTVHLCWDAISGRGEEYRRHALDRMQAAGAELTNHESVAFEWARSKEHPAFREMSRVLREGQPE